MKAFHVVLILFFSVIFLTMGLLLGPRLLADPSALPLFATPSPAPPAVEPLPVLSLRPETQEEELLDRAYGQVWRYTLEGPCESDGETAQQRMTLTVLDIDAFAGSGAREDLIEKLGEKAVQTRLPGELYDSEGAFLPEQVWESYCTVLQERMTHPEDYCMQKSLTLRYRYGENGWELLNEEELFPNRPDPALLYTAAAQNLPYLPLHFSLPEDALRGSLPQEDRYVFTEDPTEIAALLQRPEAKALIGEEQILWNPDIAFLPGTLIRCYLDESILCLVWQEEEARAVGTFSEIFVSDGSQLRRKISSDAPWSLWFEKTTDFAKEANAVLAVGGDFYYHGRDCGISVYNREIIRFRPDNADTCFITADGDLLFRYLGEETDQAETEAFLRENDILFSLAFGPVLIDNGVDVTPENYLWGEVRDYYARSALGLLGRHHYLTMNINCGKGEYDHLPSLRDAADAMVKRGCWKAYTLDGGQTATTAFHGELINPVQFGWEKKISDVIYFASAIPENEE